MSNVKRLRDAGVLAGEDHHFDDDHREVINNLSKDEVDALVKLHGKLKHIKPKKGDKGSAFLV